jgi:NAD(P)-dependent dehydrogenase (short-subunit alcohol dehydrogenase family)
MRRILVTGANKGIGLAIVERLLAEHADTFVYLGTRDEGRGREAAEKVVAATPGARERLEVLVIDVADEQSVLDAAKSVAAKLGAEKLYGVINNAGINSDRGDLAALLETNTIGIRRVCDAFIPLLEPDGGRIVNVTSGSGSMFVQGCSPEMQAFFCDASTPWEKLRAFVTDCASFSGTPDALRERGLGGPPYGLSKACANLLSSIIARENPRLIVNACSPGFIATDMTQPYADAEGKTPAEMGMKTPYEGATAPLYLLFEAKSTGWYYGSDCKRSPLDRYRSPGSPAYTGD